LPQLAQNFAPAAMGEPQNLQNPPDAPAGAPTWVGGNGEAGGVTPDPVASVAETDDGP